MDKRYLGDSVYVRVNAIKQLVLTTENGLEDDPRNTIFLEPEVFANLEAYIAELNKEDSEDDESN